MNVLAFDTSNYTTSVAFYDGETGVNHSQLLDVEQGSLGLRQSDALFAHVKRLPDLSDRLFADIGAKQIAAIGVSTRPRAEEGSYMPCFLAGASQAQVLGAALHVPVYAFSHQQGHIAAALWSARRMDLLDKPHLAWHLSGGTTELLYVTPQESSVHAQRIGGTTDISAGQLIDRAGKLLGLQFPSGKQIDALSAQAKDTAAFRVKVHSMEFSLSGVENKVREYHAGACAAETAGYVLRCLIGAIVTASENALRKYPHCPLVFAGGVASNRMLQSKCAPLRPLFCEPRFATDNALGTAILAWRAQHAAANF
ncbi:MAG: DNA-binding protein [Oscillospiraceae bacterium]|jgi:N6-L-threonylcarbamoyladenine synthase|nr:DNA-binding protein [Oscillospiraceae bacterium]